MDRQQCAVEHVQAWWQTPTCRIDSSTQPSGNYCCCGTHKEAASHKHCPGMHCAVLACCVAALRSNNAHGCALLHTAVHFPHKHCMIGPADSIELADGLQSWIIYVSLVAYNDPLLQGAVPGCFFRIVGVGDWGRSMLRGEWVRVGEFRLAGGVTQGVHVDTCVVDYLCVVDYISQGRHCCGGPRFQEGAGFQSDGPNRGVCAAACLITLKCQMVSSCEGSVGLGQGQGHAVVPGVACRQKACMVQLVFAAGRASNRQVLW
jgi:hypothetical protein